MSCTYLVDLEVFLICTAGKTCYVDVVNTDSDTATVLLPRLHSVMEYYLVILLRFKMQNTSVVIH